MPYFCNMKNRMVLTIIRGLLCAGFLACLGGFRAQGQNFDRYGNRNDPYDRHTDRHDPFDRNRTYGSDSLNAFGERILSREEQERQDSAARASGRSVRDRKIYSNRYRDSIQVYKIIDLRGDTTLVDTTLNIGKYYRMNPTRRDE